QIVGEYNSSHPFLLSGGTFYQIDFPRSLNSAATGINDLGQIVGHYTDEGFVRHGFLLGAGIFSTGDVPDASFTAAAGVNNLGQIVGLYSDPTGFHGFLATPVAEPGSVLFLASGLAGVILFAILRAGRQTWT